MNRNLVKDAEEKRVRQFVESQMGLRLPDGWFLELNKRMWIDVVPEQRVVGMWGCHSGLLLKIRRSYESFRHMGSEFWFDPVLEAWPEGLQYRWLIRRENRLIPLAEAIELEHKNRPS